MYDKHTGFLMATPILPRSLTTLRLATNLLYRRSGLHLDGLHRTRQLKAAPHSPLACYRADRLGNPRWGFLMSRDMQSVVGNGDCLTNILTQERDFLQ